MASVTGKQYQAALASAKTSADADRVTFDMLGDDGAGAPDFIRSDWWKWVTITDNAAGIATGHRLRVLVAPDYLALGDDDNAFPVARVTPYLAAKAARVFGAILPSRKLLHDLEAASDPHIPYLDVKGAPYRIPLAKIESQEATDAMAQMRRAAFVTKGVYPENGFDAPVLGYRKAIVVGPELDGSHVAIAGGRYPQTGAKFATSAAHVQPYSTIHTSDYGDYSHGIVLVSHKAELDGEMVDLRTDVFGSNDPSIVALVSDQGRFDPVFPNAGKNSQATFRGTTPAPKGSVSKGASKSGAPVTASSGIGTAGKVLGVLFLGGLITWAVV